MEGGEVKEEEKTAMKKKVGRKDKRIKEGESRERKEGRKEGEVSPSQARRLVLPTYHHLPRRGLSLQQTKKTLHPQSAKASHITCHYRLA